MVVTNSCEDPLKLIHTAKSAIIVGTFATVPQNEEVADWIEQTAPGKQIKHFFTTDAHPDHFMFFPVLQKRFRGIKAVATHTKYLRPSGRCTHRTGSDFGQASFRIYATLRNMSGKHFQPRMSSSSMDIFSKHMTWSRATLSANSFLHSLDLVGAGDLVCGDCYQYLAEENTKEKRANWTKATEQIERLKPKIVVPGHKRRSQIGGAYLTEPTKGYIRVFEGELDKADSAEELEKRMIELHPERWNRFILERSCQSSFAMKEQQEIRGGRRMRKGLGSTVFPRPRKRREVIDDHRKWVLHILD